MNQSVRRTSESSGGGVASMPYIKIIEQPASKALRFRYECEGRSAGSIPGVNSTPENKTFPTIQIVGYRGRAVVVVSCVTKDSPYRPHPHNLVGKEGCKKGVCTVEINNETMTAAFANLGIQCVKKKDIEEALRVREEIRVDPFRTGFSHKTQTSGIDLNSVRLCFQAFLEGPQRGKFTNPLSPIVSEPIYDKKAMADLVICKLSHCSGSVAGGNEIILLCEKVAKEDISVRFYEEKDGQVVWEGLGDFTPTQVHKQVAISFRTPRYKTLEIEQPVQVLIQLRRPSDNATSEALPFQITPLDSDHAKLKRKRQKFSNEPEVLREMQDTAPMRVGSIESNSLAVKREPETSPNPYGLYGGGTMTMKHSPAFPRTPSPLDYAGAAGGYYNPTISGASTQLPNYNPVYVDPTYLHGQIGNAATGGIGTAAAVPSTSTAISPQPQTAEILDMDRQQIFELGSADLEELTAIGLSDNLSANLSLNDVDNMSMSDSITNLRNKTLNELFPDMYRTNQNT
ncbi:embryonic polarity protein dorsal-like isoform X6 [Rhodnius prolixus]